GARVRGRDHGAVRLRGHGREPHRNRAALARLRARDQGARARGAGPARLPERPRAGRVPAGAGGPAASRVWNRARRGPGAARRLPVPLRGHLDSAPGGGGGQPRRRAPPPREAAAMIPTSHFLILAAVLFAIGLLGALVRRNALIVLMSVEL